MTRGPTCAQVAGRASQPGGFLFAGSRCAVPDYMEARMDLVDGSTVVMIIAFLFILVLVGLLIIQEPI